MSTNKSIVLSSDNYYGGMGLSHTDTLICWVETIVNSWGQELEMKIILLLLAADVRKAVRVEKWTTLIWVTYVFIPFIAH